MACGLSAYDHSFCNDHNKNILNYTHSIFLPGEVHGQRSPVGYRSWGHKEWHNTEWKKKSPSCIFSTFSSPPTETLDPFNIPFSCAEPAKKHHSINIVCLYDFDSSS